GHDRALAGAPGENDVGNPNVTAQGGKGDVLVVLIGQEKIGHGAQYGQGLGDEGKDKERGQQGENDDEQSAPSEPFHFASGQACSLLFVAAAAAAGGLGFFGHPFVIFRLGNDFDGARHGVMP